MSRKKLSMVKSLVRVVDSYLQHLRELSSLTLSSLWSSPISVNSTKFVSNLPLFTWRDLPYHFLLAFSILQMPSSSSPPSSPNVAEALTPAKTTPHSFTVRKLTRQRKLRHVSIDDLGLQFSDFPYKLSASPELTRKSPSPTVSDHWSSSAVPKPLPLPASSSLRKPNSLGSNSPGEGPGGVLAR